MMKSWTMRLIAANVVMFLLTQLQPSITLQLMLVPSLLVERPWTLFTYMFLHAGTLHLLFNMLGLYFFGPRLEEEMGGRDFLYLYFISGITGALLSFLTPNAWIVGASGAIFGVFLGYARFWPRETIMIWGIIPLEARWFVAIMTALSIFGGFSGGGNVAHFAHLGGFLGGYLFLRLREFRQHSRLRKLQGPVVTFGRSDVGRWKAIDKNALHEVNRTELERILAKLDAQGPESLTSQEQLFLERFSRL
jgi:membrane associated rhomboid family serine protease